MNILSVNSQDLAGLSYNLCVAINELTNHHAVNVVLTPTWAKLPAMISGRKNSRRKVPKLMRNADVIHINEFPNLLYSMGAKPESWQDKQIIYHVHGSRFITRRNNYLRYIHTNFPKAKMIAATPNLLPFIPEATWFPFVIPIKQYREEYPIQRNDPPRLYGAHTKVKKHQRTLVKITNQLWEEGLKFEAELVSKRKHACNLKHKAQADIYLDGIRPFYGVSVMEASAFEMPSVTGMDAFSRKYVLEHEIDCPYIIGINYRKQKDAIRQLILDRSLREEEGKRAYEYVKRMHSPEVGVERFLEMVE